MLNKHDVIQNYKEKHIHCKYGKPKTLINMVIRYGKVQLLQKMK